MTSSSTTRDSATGFSIQFCPGIGFLIERILTNDFTHFKWGIMLGLDLAVSWRPQYVSGSGIVTWTKRLYFPLDFTLYMFRTVTQWNPTSHADTPAIISGYTNKSHEMGAQGHLCFAGPSRTVRV